MTLTAKDRVTIRWALMGWAQACRNRANAIAQDKNGYLRDRYDRPIPTEAVGDALAEAEHAERLVAAFREVSGQ